MSEKYNLKLTAGELGFKRLWAVTRKPVTVTLDDAAEQAIATSQSVVDKVIAEGRTVYGVNTGFGLLANKSIPTDQLQELQRNLVLSHAAGTGPLLDDDVVRLILVLKLNSLARGFSGVRRAVVDQLIAFLDHEIYPCIPSQGSVGASGDLAPLAHMSAALIGEGDVRVGGDIMPATKALEKAGLKPLVLGPKEGLALLNGTQVSTALALKGYFDIARVFDAAMLAGALSVDALKGSDTPFDARIHEIRGQKGQKSAALLIRRLLKGSAIRQSHEDCERVQDPYSLRCQPQVMGAALDMMDFTAAMLIREANAVSDNPLVFADNGDILSGGNFHAEPVAMAADALAIAASEVGAISERRIALLIDPHLSGLPAFLVKESGINSGFMIAQVTAAALASENKSLAHPASVDSLPTSANQEDHVSMATYAARRLGQIAQNVAGIIAVELLAAAQGIEFHRPLESSPGLEELMSEIRNRVAPYDKDRFFAPDIEAVKQLVLSRTIDDLIEKHVPDWWSREPLVQ